MKQINQFIQEKLRINKDIKVKKKTEFKYFPKDKKELRTLLRKRLKEDPNANLNDIDISKVKEMNSMFSYTDIQIGNIDISEWDVSHVTDMTRMFFGQSFFNCDLSEWDVSNVRSLNHTFYGCEELDFDASNWNIKSCKDTYNTFKCCNNMIEPSWYDEKYQDYGR